MKHNVEAFKKYYVNATKEEVIEDMFLDNCNLQQEIERLNNRIDKAIEYMNDTIDFSWKDNSPIKSGKSLSLNKLLDILKGSDKE